MKRSGLPDGYCDFGDYFYIVGRDGDFALETVRGVVGSGLPLERKTVETGFASRAEARQRATALCLSPKCRRARFRFIKGEVQ